MKREQVPVTTPYIKLDSFLKFAGAAGTGGMAKAMVLEGLVEVDGAPCRMRGKKLYPGMVVRVAETGMEYEVVPQ